MRLVKKIPNPKRGRSGFTLVEVLITILILSMVTVVIATGMPAAINAYKKIVETANAQVLLSTTMTRLREELGSAKEIKVNGSEITFRRSDGNSTRIYLEAGTADNANPGIWIREYANIEEGDAMYQPGFTHLLVSKEAANKNLYMSFSSLAYAKGVITFRDLKVFRNGDTTETGLAAVTQFQVRVLSDAINSSGS